MAGKKSKSRQKPSPSGRSQLWAGLLGLALVVGLLAMVFRAQRSSEAPPVAPVAPPAPGVVAPAPLPLATAEAEDLTQRALGLLMAERWEEAKTYLDRAVALAPDFAPAHLALAGYYNQHRDYPSAIASASAVLARDPGNPEARFAKIVAEFYDGGNPDALDELDALLADQPREPRYRFFHATTFAQVHRRQEALETLFKVADDAISDVRYFQLRAQLLCDEERWAEALSDWERVLAMQPTNEAAAGMKGLCLVRLGRLEEGLPWMQRGLVAPVDDAEQLRALARDARARGDLEMAEKYEAFADRLQEFLADREILLEAIAADPRDAELYYRLARLYNENDFTVFSIPIYQRTLALDDDHAAAHRELGAIYLRLVDSDRFFRHTERYLELEPGDLPVRMELALEYEKMRRFQDGLRVMRGYPEEIVPDITYMSTLRFMKRAAGE